MLRSFTAADHVRRVAVASVEPLLVLLVKLREVLQVHAILLHAAADVLAVEARRRLGSQIDEAVGNESGHGTHDGSEPALVDGKLKLGHPLRLVHGADEHHPIAEHRALEQAYGILPVLSRPLVLQHACDEYVVLEGVGEAFRLGVESVEQVECLSLGSRERHVLRVKLNALHRTPFAHRFRHDVHELSECHACSVLHNFLQEGCLSHSDVALDAERDALVSLELRCGRGSLERVFVFVHSQAFDVPRDLLGVVLVPDVHLIHEVLDKRLAPRADFITVINMRKL
mmetsp:Transcript_11331/g.25506  ORF Transcript_11331/g.25506 Transcript_11331/m.25506 type:complete len:285 (+) Transcript_11331:345-1199(+)